MQIQLRNKATDEVIAHERWNNDERTIDAAIKSSSFSII